MPLPLHPGYPTLCIRREAFEKAQLSRAAFDAQLGLTSDEFRVENDLVVVGPIVEDKAVSVVIAELERLGLRYFDDFFELSGNWPAWLALYARAA
jgi:hypothetical protein